MIVTDLASQASEGHDSVGGAAGAYLLIGIALWVAYRRHMRKVRANAALVTAEAVRAARHAAIAEAADVFDGTGPLAGPCDPCDPWADTDDTDTVRLSVVAGRTERPILETSLRLAVLIGQDARTRYVATRDYLAARRGGC